MDAKSKKRRLARSPSPEERVRDPEGTRRRILEAATVEFSTKGLAGGRVAEIAKRAGVNSQLIAYYFDGKAGLYQTVMKEAVSGAEGLAHPPEIEVADLVAHYYRVMVDHPVLVRLWQWQALEGLDEVNTDRRTDVLKSAVDDLAQRQADGQIPDDLDPSILLLVSIMLATAPWVFPQFVREIDGASPDDTAFQERYVEQVVRLMRHVAPGADG